MKEEDIKTLREEYEYLKYNQNPILGVTVGLPDKNNIFEWQVTLLGPKDTFYRFIFPKNFIS